MDSDLETENVKVVKKRPYLKKGTGLRRFYRNLDELENNTTVTTPVSNSVNTLKERKLENSAPDQVKDLNRNVSEPNTENRYSDEEFVQKMQSLDISSRKSKVNFEDLGLQKQNPKPSCVQENYYTAENDDDSSSEWESIDSAEEESECEDNETVQSSAGKESAQFVPEYYRVDELPDSESGSEFGIGNYTPPPHDGMKTLVESNIETQAFSSVPRESENQGRNGLQSGINSEPIPSTNCFRPPCFQDNRRVSGPGWDSELNLFEKMEQLTESLSFCSTSSTVEKFINNQLHPSVPKAQDSYPTPTTADAERSTEAPYNALNEDVARQVFDRLKQEENESLMKERDEFLKNYAHLLESDAHLHDEELAVIEALGMGQGIPFREYESAHGSRTGMETHETITRQAEETRQHYIEAMFEFRKEKRLFDTFKMEQWAKLETEKNRLKAQKERYTRLKHDLEKRQKAQFKFSSSEDAVIQLQNKLQELQKSFQQKTTQHALSSRTMRSTIDKMKTENEKLKDQVAKLTKEKELRDLRDARDRSKLLQFKRKGRVSHQVSDLKEEVENKAQIDYQMCSCFGKSKESPYSKRMGVINADLGNKAANKVDIADIVTYQNGNRLITYSDGSMHTRNNFNNVIEIVYPNGDIKDFRQSIQGITRYFYNDISTWHIVHRDGNEIHLYPSGVVEKKFADGVHEVTDPTGKIERMFPNGCQETTFPDKTVVQLHTNASETIYFPNGQVEFRSLQYNKRVFPDGTEKIVHSNGSQETRYSNGRIRVKDSTGKLIYDNLPEEPET